MYSSRPSEKIVCPWMLRARFNQRQIVRRTARNEITAQPGPLRLPRADLRDLLPPGTRSQTIRYSDRRTGRWLYLAHQFVCPHGSVLGSGFPDPKTIYDPNETLVADPLHRDWDTCGDCGTYRQQASDSQAAIEDYRQRCDECSDSTLEY